MDLVINYDVPFISNFGFKKPDFANYLHRVGRTGRFGTDGVAVSISSEETQEDILDQIETYYGIQMQRIEGISDIKKLLAEMRGEKDNGDV